MYKNNGIYGFDGEYRFLSNFYPSKFDYNDAHFATSEHAFQAMKAVERSDFFKIANAPSPSAAKRLGREVYIKRDWDLIKEDVMGDVLYAKFTQNEGLKDCLLNTKNWYLEETNTWNDTYWGVCKGVGRNRLGVLLMKLRDELRNSMTLEEQLGASFDW